MVQKSPHFLHLVLGTNLVSRTKQALVNICVKLRVQHPIFPRLSSQPWSTSLCHPPCPPRLCGLPFSFSGSSHAGRSCTGKPPVVNASFPQSFAAGGLGSRRLCCEHQAWAAHKLFLLALSAARLGRPLSSQDFILDAHRRSANISGGTWGRQLVSFLLLGISPSLLLPADREISAWQSLPTLGLLILLITMRAAGNSVGAC